MSLDAFNDEHFSGVHAELNELRIEHRDLDQVISQLLQAPTQDELLIRRLKKRKLVLKDKILLLEGMAEPDIPA